MRFSTVFVAYTLALAGFAAAQQYSGDLYERTFDADALAELHARAFDDDEVGLYLRALMTPTPDSGVTDTTTQLDSSTGGLGPGPQGTMSDVTTDTSMGTGTGLDTGNGYPMTNSDPNSKKRKKKHTEEMGEGHKRRRKHRNREEGEGYERKERKERKRKQDRPHGSRADVRRRAYQWY